MSQTSLDARTIAEYWRHHNVGLTTTAANLQSLLSADSLSLPATNLKPIMVTLVSSAEWQIGHAAGTDFKVIPADVEKVIPLVDAPSKLWVKASSGTPTLSIEAYYA